MPFAIPAQAEFLRSVGTQGNGDSPHGFVSADGSYVAFASEASNLVGEDTDNDGSCDIGCDTNGAWDVFVRDRGTCSGSTVFWVSSTSGSWHEASNWSTGAVPGPGDDVCISVAEAITVTHDGPFTNAGDITIGTRGSEPPIVNTFRVNGTYVQEEGANTVIYPDGQLVALDGITFEPGTGFCGSNMDTLQVINGGTLAPGCSPGILTISGDYVQTETGILQIELGGLSVGTEYDQLHVIGAVTLDGILDVSLIGGFKPASGDSFTIVNNEGTNAIAGTFDDLPERASLTVGGARLVISYVGGTGNDVILGRPIPVSIDIKPGSEPNCFNIDGHGVVPAAINGSAQFDVSNIDVSSLILAGLEVRLRGQDVPQCSMEDWNADGYLDLVCHFEDNTEDWEPGNGMATLTGFLNDGTLIEGTDEICVVP